MKHARHGMSGTPEYHAWTNMRSRCYYKRDKKYADYGGRGIQVCAGWRSSFTSFISDMGMRPGLGYCVDRKDNDANYSCGHCSECVANGWTTNCRWVTHRQNQRNRRNTVIREIGGRMVTLAEVEREVSVHELAKRLDRGVPLDVAVRRANLQPATLTIDGATKTAGEWCRAMGVNYQTWRSRVRDLGMDPVAAMSTSRKPRASGVRRCRICHQPGHTVRTCTATKLAKAA